MELFVLRYQEWERIFNCTPINVDAIPVEQRQFIGLSVACIALGTFYYCLYIPCMFSIWRHTANNACFQLMFVVGLCDLGALWTVSLYVGWAGLVGHVFCSAPTLSYFHGLLNETFFYPKCMSEFILAFNRCLCMLFPKAEHVLFSGKAIYVWLSAVGLYSGYYTLFPSVPTYSSIPFGGWNYNPFSGYAESPPEAVQPFIHKVNNYTLALGVPALYLAFALAFILKFKEYNVQMRKQMPVFVQVFLISLFTCVTGLIYVYVAPAASTTVMPLILIIGEFCVINMHGSAPLVYLLLNHNVQQDVKQMLLSLAYRCGLSKAAPPQHLTSVVVQLVQPAPLQNTIRAHPVASVVGGEK